MNHRTQRSVAGDLGQPATGTDQQGASHCDWRHAQKLTVNNSSTQTDCQTSDITVKYCYNIENIALFQWRRFAVSAQTFFSAQKLLSGHASSYVKIIMRPSSVGGGRILRCTLSVRLSVCPSVPFVEVVFLLFTLQPSYERTSKTEKLWFSIIGQRQPCGRAVPFVLFTCAGRIKYGDQPHKLVKCHLAFKCR